MAPLQFAGRINIGKPVNEMVRVRREKAFSPQWV